MRLSELLRNTPLAVRVAARTVPPPVLVDRREKEVGSLKGTIWIWRVKSSEGERYYRTEIWLDEGGNARVFCSCPYFRFHLYYALRRAGALLARARGYQQASSRPPRLKNPEMVPYLCKHLYACALRI